MRLASASPNTAPRPWPTCIGPVGLADTYSTLTARGALRWPRPNAGPSATTARVTSRSTSGCSRRLMNPGPATSTAVTPGSPRSAWASVSASARGLDPASLASTNAALVARSPCNGSRGGSITTLAVSSPAGTAPSRPSRSITAPRRRWNSSKMFMGPICWRPRPVPIRDVSESAPNAIPEWRQTGDGAPAGRSGPSCRRCSRPRGGPPSWV